MPVKPWFVKIEEDFERVKFCPFCGSKQVSMPNDLCEWICKDCGAWFEIR